MTGPMIIVKAKYFYDKVKITNKCMFSDRAGCKVTK